MRLIQTTLALLAAPVLLGSLALPLSATPSPVAWHKTSPDSCIERTNTALSEAEAVCEAIIALRDEDSTFENTWEALDKAQQKLLWEFNLLNHLNRVADTPDNRKALAELSPKITEFKTRLNLNEALYKKLKAFADNPEKTKDLHPTQHRLMTVYLEDFERNGVALPDDKKKRYAEIMHRLDELGQLFKKLKADSTNAWSHLVTDPSKLDGIPEQIRMDALNEARVAGYKVDESPQWLFTLKSTATASALKYAKNAELRRKLKEGLDSVCSGEWDTQALIDEVLKLRNERAHILGYTNFFDFTTSNRMAQNGKTVETLLDDIFTKAKPAFDKECTDIIAYANENKLVPNTPVSKLHSADIAYVSEEYRRHSLDLDSRELLEYFPEDHVLSVMFDEFSKLFDITFTRIPTYVVPDNDDTFKAPSHGVEVWHPDVQFYEVKDGATGRVLGGIFCDWYVREGKRAGAWANRMPTDPYDPRYTIIVCNSNRPTETGKPAPFSLENVGTIFHEMGHALHGVLSESPYWSLAGTSVVHDFVEFPSKLLPNFLWEKDMLRRISLNRKDETHLPDDIIEKILKSQHYLPGSSLMGDIRIAKIDLELHYNLKDHLGKPLDEDESLYLAEYRIPTEGTTKSIARSLHHLFDGPGSYAGGYYTYLWGTLHEADAYKKIKEALPTDPTIGLKLRNEILRMGNTRPAQEVFRNFMGRELDTAPYFERSGISTQP